MHGAVNGERKMTDSVECSGSETGLEKCRVRYSSDPAAGCKLEENIVSIKCVHDSLAVCDSKNGLGEFCRTSVAYGMNLPLQRERYRGRETAIQSTLTEAHLWKHK